MKVDLAYGRTGLEVEFPDDRTTVIAVDVDREVRVPGYESWWDVPIAEVSTVEEVQAARKEYEKMVKTEKYFL